MASKDCCEIDTATGVVSRVCFRESSECCSRSTVSAEVMHPLHAKQSLRETFAVFSVEVLIMLEWTEQSWEGFKKSFKSVIFMVPENSIL